MVLVGGRVVVERRRIGSGGLLVEVPWKVVLIRLRIGGHVEGDDEVRTEILVWRGRHIFPKVCISSRISRFARGLARQLVTV